MVIEAIIENTIEFKPGHAYLLFVDPEKIDFKSFMEPWYSGVEPAPDILIIASRDGHTPAYAEGITQIEQWLERIKREGLK